MTKKYRVVNTQNLEEFAKALIAKAKNSDRAVFRLTENDGAIIHVTYKDIPIDSANYNKIMAKTPELFWGCYNTKARVEDIVRDLSCKD